MWITCIKHKLVEIFIHIALGLNNDFIKDIHIGNFIRKLVAEKKISISRICSFLDRDEDEILKMFESKSLDTALTLKWCKLLEYDLFRIYSQHLILYAPGSKVNKLNITSIPQFRKNIYTAEIIEFVIEQVITNKMTKKEITDRYRIPKTTLYKWLTKYKIKDES